MNVASGKSAAGRAGLAATCVWLGAFACSQQNAAQHPPQAGDVAVATVNGQTVWASDVKREAALEGLIGEGEPLDISSPTFHQALDELIDEKLLAAEAERQHLGRDPETKRRLAAARERILGDMLVENLVERTVSESSIQGLYADEVRSAGQGQELHAAQIVAASQADAQAVKKALAGGAAFEQLAMQRSIDAQTRLSGGDLGYFTPDVLPPAYAAALKDAKPGDIVGPFQTDAGWVVLKLEDRRAEAPISLDAARPEIVNFLTYEGVRDLLKRLRQQSRIKLLLGAAAPSGTEAPEPASAPAAPPAQAASAAPPTVSSTPPSASSGPPNRTVAAVQPPRHVHPRPIRASPPAPPRAQRVPVITVPPPANQSQ
ncbi:MAG TPA: peptidylprolyl isomerase [Caulobacteraceae bacterium]|nr:peptidylprolyl isomerase [Caulobacteraceae bacterium]